MAANKVVNKGANKESNKYEGFAMGGRFDVSRETNVREESPPSGGSFYTVLSWLCFLIALVFTAFGVMNRYYAHISSLGETEETPAALPALTDWMAVLDQVDLFQGQFAIAFIAFLLGMFFSLKGTLSRLYNNVK